MSIGVKRTSIHSLSHGSTDFLLVAVIIAKQTPRIIQSKTAISLRCVWSFTLRDSPADYINVTFWGPPEFIENIARNFHVGDVVDLIKARVTYRRNEDANFMPDVTSPLLLVMNENISEMCLHSEDDCADFHRLLRLPTRPPSDYLTLSDVHNNGQALRGKHVNLLVAVKSVGALRQVTTKSTGKLLDCREVEVMDQSPTSLYIQLWDTEHSYLAENWKPRETVLFIADIRIDWNNYKKGIVATVTARTIVTENPNISDVADLREHARSAPSLPTAILDQLATNFPDPNTINTVMSCQTVWNRAVNSESAESFTALVYAAIIDMDLDGLCSLVVTKCLQCGSVVDDNIGLCLTAECPVSSGLAPPQTERAFDIKVTLGDHTGSLAQCKLTTAAAAQALDCMPEQFELLSVEGRTQLKWQFLLKRVASRIVVLPATRDRLSPLYSILTLERITLTDYAAHLPMY